MSENGYIVPARTVVRLCYFSCVLAQCATPVQASAQALWQVDSVPVLLSDDAFQHEHPLSRPVAAFRLPSGSVVVADSHSGSLYYHGSSVDGWIARGRRGDGPGEFHHIAWAGNCGRDSVFAWDLMRQRMIVYDGNGNFVREFRISGHKGFGPPLAIACSCNAQFMFQPLPRVAKPEGADMPIIRGRAPIIVNDADGNVIGRTIDVAGGEMVLFGGGSGPRPLGKRTLLAGGSNRMYVGTGDSSTIVVHGIDGQTLDTIPVFGNTRSPSKTDQAEAIEAIASSVTGQMRAVVEGWLASVPVPNSLPPYSALLVDSEGLIWVDISGPSDGERNIYIYDPLGPLVARVRVPDQVTVTDVGRDYIIGVVIDDDGIPQIVRYRLRRVGPDARRPEACAPPSSVSAALARAK